MPYRQLPMGVQAGHRELRTRTHRLLVVRRKACRTAPQTPTILSTSLRLPRLMMMCNVHAVLLVQQ